MTPHVVLCKSLLFELFIGFPILFKYQVLQQITPTEIKRPL